MRNSTDCMSLPVRACRKSESYGPCCSIIICKVYLRLTDSHEGTTHRYQGSGDDQHEKQQQRATDFQQSGTLARYRCPRLSFQVLLDTTTTYANSDKQSIMPITNSRGREHPIRAQFGLACTPCFHCDVPPRIPSSFHAESLSNYFLPEPFQRPTTLKRPGRQLASK